MQDPQELTDLGESADHTAILDEMYDHLLHWATRNSQRQTKSKQQIINMRKGKATGIVIGAYDESDMPERATLKYRNRTAPHWRDRHGNSAGRNPAKLNSLRRKQRPQAAIPQVGTGSALLLITNIPGEPLPAEAGAAPPILPGSGFHPAAF